MVIGDLTAPANADAESEAIETVAGDSAGSDRGDGSSGEGDSPPEQPETVEELAPREGPPRPSKLVVLLAVVLFLSIVAAFLGVFAFGLSGLQEHRSQAQLYSQFRELLGSGQHCRPQHRRPHRHGHTGGVAERARRGNTQRRGDRRHLVG